MPEDQNIVLIATVYVQCYSVAVITSICKLRLIEFFFFFFFFFFCPKNGLRGHLQACNLLFSVGSYLSTPECNICT